MRLFTCLSIAAVLIAPVQAQERRGVGAHQHGHGTLNIALDGAMLSMELIAPGADIAGFEHEAKSANDKEKVVKAKAALTDAARIVSLDAAAGCTLSEVTVDTGQEKGSHAHDKHGDRADHGGHKDHGGHDGHGAHSEFRVSYAFQCANADAITQVALPYFDTFPKAEELDVTIITPKGQLKRKATRKAPSAAFADAP